MRPDNDPVRYAYAGQWFPRPRWMRWEVRGAVAGVVLLLLAYGLPVWRWWLGQ